MRANKATARPELNTSNMQAEAVSVLAFLNSVDVERKRSEKEQAQSLKLLIRGAKASTKGEPQKAAKFYLQAYRMDPENKKALALLGNLLVTSGQRQEAIAVFERLIDLGKLEPSVIFDVANLAASLDMQPAAENLLASYVQLCPDDPKGYTTLSAIKRALGKYDDAISMLKFAIEQNPTVAILWESLGVAVGEDRNVDASRPFFDEAIRLNPDLGAAYANVGLQYNSEGRFEEGLPFLEKGSELLPTSANTRFNLAHALIGTGQLQRGWQEYAWRLDKTRPDTINFTHGLPRWQGEDISDKVLLVCDEQGLGDLFLFATMFDDLIARAKHCIIEIDPRLVAVLQRSFPQATFHRHVTYRVNARLHRNYRWLDDLDIRPDLATESGTLSQYLRAGLSDFPDENPYLKPDPEAVALWRERFDALGPGLKVGLTWRGGLRTVARDRSYTTMEDYGPILSVPGVHFINCMYSDAAEEIAYARDKFGVTIHDWDDIDRRDDLEAAAAYTAALDHMISIRSSPGAIASALGIPTATMQRARGSLMLGTDHEPWYPSRKIFYAERRDDWPDGPIQRVADHLRDLSQG